MGKKKFNRRIKKAGKMITNGIKKKELTSGQQQIKWVPDNKILSNEYKISELP